MAKGYSVSDPEGTAEWNELMVISHVFMLISHVHLFTNANEISLKVSPRDLPLPLQHFAFFVSILAK